MGLVGGQGAGVVNWFRKHLKHGSRLALLALAIQFALSFGHFHAEIARAAPAVQVGPTGAVVAIAASLAAQETQPEAAQPPSGHDTDQHSLDCAICAVLSVAKNFLFAAPPPLALPAAVRLPHLTTGAEFTHLGAPHPAFRSRAPPVS
jgi:hypothetical protein